MVTTNKNSTKAASSTNGEQSTNYQFTDTYITVHKKYEYSMAHNSISLVNEFGDKQVVSIEKFQHLCEHIAVGKKFVQTLQSCYRGIYNNKETDKPDIKIQGNLRFEEGFVLLEVLHGKDGSAPIVGPKDVFKRYSFKIDKNVLFAYHAVFKNEMIAHDRLAKLALERSVNLSECLTL